MANSRWRIANGKWSAGLYALFAIHYLLFPFAFADQTRLFALLERMEKSYGPVQDYTAVFRKRERINGELRPEEVSYIKFQKPLKVYMRWLAGPNEGREALYVANSNDNKVLIYEPRGFLRFFTFLLDPGGSRILKDSRYPFTEIGIGRLIERVGSDARRAWNKRELLLVDRGRNEIKMKEVRLIEGIFPKDPRAGYSSYRTILAIDEGSGLPIKATSYDWENLLTGEYSYEDLRLNPGLSEADFDPLNRSYSFPRWRISLSDGE